MVALPIAAGRKAAELVSIPRLTQLAHPAAVRVAPAAVAILASVFLRFT